MTTHELAQLLLKLENKPIRLYDYEAEIGVEPIISPVTLNCENKTADSYLIVLPD
jgi:hypothetical protein